MQTLAVVPIFITAGSAVLPTIIAALTGAAAMLLRPKELVSLIRRRPAATLSTVAVLACAFASYWYWPRAATAAKGPPRTDWVAVAQQIIAREKAGTPTTLPTSIPAAQTTPFVEGRTYARNNYDGGPAPVGLTPLWAYTPEDTMFLATPAVVGNRIYAAGCTSGLGDYSGLLACIDVDTGKPIWEVSDINGEPLKALFSSPAVTADGKSVILGEGFHTDRNCSLRCFDTATGKQRWAVKSTEHIESSPAILGDLVVVGVGAIEDHAGRPTGDPGYLMAVKISTGEMAWRHPLIDAESSPAIGEDGTIYAGSGLNGEAVGAVDSNTGKPNQRWLTPVGLAATATVSLAKDLVIAAAGNGDFAHSNPNPKGAVIAIDRKSGVVRWRTELSDAVLAPVAVADDILITASRDGDLVALNPADGRVCWRTNLSGASPVLSGSAITADKVYSMAADGTLAILDRASGRIIEKHATNAPGKAGEGLASAAPTIVGGRLIVGTETGGVRCFVGQATR